LKSHGPGRVALRTPTLSNANETQKNGKARSEKSVKKTLTIPAWLNTAALEKGINFSQVLQDALKRQLHVG